MAKPGKKPYGSTPQEAKVVERIKLLARGRKGGKTPGPFQIARELNDKGIKTRCGGLWTAQGVKNVLESRPQARKRYPKKHSLGPNDYLTVDELAFCQVIMKQTGDDLNELIVWVAAGSGLRPSELCALQLRELPIFHGKNAIEVRRGKGCKQRSVTLYPEVAEKINEFCEKYHKNAGRLAWLFVNKNGRKLSYRTLHRRVKKIGVLIGRPQLHPHVFRHTFATILYNYKKDIITVRDQLGHSSTKVTEIYTKVPDEAKKADLKGVEEKIRAARGRIVFGKCQRIDVKGQTFLNLGVDNKIQA